MRNTIFNNAAIAAARPQISLEEEIQANVAMVDAMADIERTTGEIAHAEDVIAALEDLAVVATSIKEASPHEAALMQIAGDALVAGTGAEASALTPAMEEGAEGVKNFSAKAKETIKKIWEAIKAAFGKLLDRARKFFGHGRVALQARKAQTVALRKRIEEHKGKLSFPIMLTLPRNDILWNSKMSGDKVNLILDGARDHIQVLDKFLTMQHADEWVTWNRTQECEKALRSGDNAPAMNWKPQANAFPNGSGSQAVDSPLEGIRIIRHNLNFINFGMRIQYASCSGFTVVNSGAALQDAVEKFSEITSFNVSELPRATQEESDVAVTFNNVGAVLKGLELLDEITDDLEKLTDGFMDRINTDRNTVTNFERGAQESAVPEVARMLTSQARRVNRALARTLQLHASLTRTVLHMQMHYHSLVNQVMAKMDSVETN
jgi:hypothetical protein